jgi:sensor histidine kinase YesM
MARSLELSVEVTMALSDREQRLLDELERGLYESDPNLAQKIGSAGARTPARLIAGLVISLIGVSLIVFAVMIQVAFFGVFAFLVMLAGLIFASSNMSQTTTKASGATSGGKSKNLFEERWNRRQGD